MEYFIEAQHLVKKFEQHTALNDVSISIPKGQVFGLLGPNGAGKTTFIRIINRITVPDSGRVLFDGRPFEPSDVMRIGYLPEERGLYKKMKVGDQALYLAQLKGLTHREAKERLTYWFEKFDIMPWWNKKLEELSKGMQQKVQFVITVLHRPPLLIFDEPFSGFDPLNAELLKKEILALRDEGHTVVFSTHNMSSVEEVCDHFALINHAQVVLSGRVMDVRRQFRTGLYEVVTVGGTLVPDPTYDIVSVEEQYDEHRYVLRKKVDGSNSDWLPVLTRQAEVRLFAEQLPTMNDIFIQTVNSASNQA
ncbi:aBC transporter ATP-binding protein [Prevotella sp. CAG:617]|nr:aBC transporter ATP-binding protein [Prevotella sp. CAG:617]